MKKNLTFKLGMLILALTLVTSCFLGGTLAKYTTSANGEDTATVAKWGVGVTNNIANLFDFTDTGVSSGSKLAPGTTGNKQFAFTAATPEVAYSLIVDATCQYTIDGNVVDGTTYEWPGDYYPIVYQLDGDGTGTWLDLAELQTALEGLSAANNAPGTPISAATHTITWKWEFTGDDAKDTALGDNATALGVSITVNISVTQLDTYTP